jgi:hypothetical protein
MRRQIIILTAVILAVAAAAPAQDMRRYPPDTSVACVLWGDCRTHRRLRPSDPSQYAVPRSVGAWTQWPDMSEGPLPWWHLITGRPFFDTLAEMVDRHDIRAVGFALRAHPTENIYENIRKAFRVEGIDILVLWLEHWANTEPSCDGSPYLAWQNLPPDIFEQLYTYYANQPKTIIVMTFESSQRLHGKGCLARDECAPGTWYADECPAVCEENPDLGVGWWLPEGYVRPDDCQSICCDLAKSRRRDYMLQTFNELQSAVQSARIAHADAKLKVFFAVEIDRFSNQEEWLLTARDVLPYMDALPDFIGLSLWPAKAGDVVESFRRVQGWVSLPSYRFFIAEVGAKERWTGEQRDRIMSVVPPLFDAGLTFALVWSMEQPHPAEQTGHALIDPVTGDLRSGYSAYRELNDIYR